MGEETVSRGVESNEGGCEGGTAECRVQRRGVRKRDFLFKLRIFTIFLSVSLATHKD